MDYLRRLHVQYYNDTDTYYSITIQMMVFIENEIIALSNKEQTEPPQPHYKIVDICKTA